jgi:ADP-ribose pyrophosphatase YjhB (NUDIX family)
MKPAEQIAAWSDQLRDISAMGLHFSKNPYDIENYHTIQDIAIAMLALAVDEPLEQIEALRAPIFSRPTPCVTGDAAILDDEGRMLLIRRADNGKWAMPGGALAVGETPAQGVAREALEETGWRCQPERLVGVFDSRLCGQVSRHHLYMFVFLCKPLEQVHQGPLHTQEVLETAWFAEDELPEPIDAGHVTRIPAAFQAWRQGGAAFFDCHNPGT